MIATIGAIVTAMNIYVACCVLAYGLTFASFQGSYPRSAGQMRRTDMGFAILMSVFGPMSLVLAFLLSGLGEHGLKFR